MVYGSGFRVFVTCVWKLLSGAWGPQSSKASSSNRFFKNQATLQVISDRNYERTQQTYFVRDGMICRIGVDGKLVDFSAPALDVNHLQDLSPLPLLLLIVIVVVVVVVVVVVWHLRNQIESSQSEIKSNQFNPKSNQIKSISQSKSTAAQNTKR
jgi:cell division protein FtsL